MDTQENSARITMASEFDITPIPDTVPRMPWIQLGSFEAASSKTPPPKPFPVHSSPAERAAARLAVQGNAIFMNFPPTPRPVS